MVKFCLHFFHLITVLSTRGRVKKKKEKARYMALNNFKIFLKKGIAYGLPKSL